MERKFFFGILSAMSSDFVKELVNEATALRQAHRQSKVHIAEEMPISQEWAAALLSQPFIPCKYHTFLLFRVYLSSPLDLLYVKPVSQTVVRS